MGFFKMISKVVAMCSQHAALQILYFLSHKKRTCGGGPGPWDVWHIWLKAAMTAMSCLSLTLISLVRGQVVTLQQLPGVDSVTARPS
jgi:hypothetical protein